MMPRIARRLRAFWHRRELRWALDELGLKNLNQLEALLDTPLSEAEQRFLATRERILVQRGPTGTVGGYCAVRNVVEA